MLTYMRSRSKTWVKWIIFGAIIVVFVFWGGSSYWGNEKTKLAKIDRHIISPQQYNKAYEDALRNLQSRLGNAPTQEMIKQLNLKEKVLDELINEYVLNEEAAKMGISISDAELQKAIQSFPAFQQDGRFSPDNYKRLLAYQRLTPRDFEELERKDLLKQRVYALVTENTTVSTEEIVSFYKYLNDTFSLNFLTFDAQTFVKNVNMNDQELTAYYDKNKEKYKIPPKIVLTYIDFPVASYMSKVTVSLDDAKDYYDSHKDEFTTKARVHGRHILIKVPQGADNAVVEQKRSAAQKIYSDIKAGGDFAALAKKYSEDPGTNFLGGDIGLVPKDSLPEPLGEKLAKMNPGELSPPVRTSLGFHILRAEGKEEGKLPAYEEVSTAIAEKMKLERAKIMAGDDANNSFKELYEQGGTNLSAYAQSKGLQVKQIGPVAMGENVPLPNAADLIKKAFLYPKGEIGSVAETQDGYMIYMVKEKIAARIPELSEVKDKVVNDLKVSKASELAKTYAANLAKNTAQINAMAYQTTGDFKRTAYVIPQIGTIPGVKQDLEKMGSPKVYSGDSKVYIVWLGKRQEADVRTADPGQLKQIRNQLLSRKKEMAVETFIQEARKRHKITIDTDKFKDIR